ncbi:MAG: M23 family metallopeptidase [Treponema sp.]|nr:M23 family metallopeptidase [Treponema sp.]
MALIFLAFLCRAQETDQHAAITALSAKDPVFMRYMRDVETAFQAIARKKKDFVPVLYTYTADKDDTVLNLAARCSIPQDTFATINRIHSTDTFLEGKKLILPAARGLFIPEKAEGPLEILLQNSHPEYLAYPACIVNNQIFRYSSSGRFDSEERAFFLDSSLVMPLPDSVLTSSFGMRQSPFTGAWQFHRGIDLAAPVGTPVSACKAGVVAFTGYTGVYGNHIIVSHAGNMKSLYAHLSEMAVKPGDGVKRGEVIGKVGVTGATTGPHLHFEIQVDNTPRDPGELVKGVH